MLAPARKVGSVWRSCAGCSRACISLQTLSGDRKSYWRRCWCKNDNTSDTKQRLQRTLSRLRCALQFAHARNVSCSGSNLRASTGPRRRHRFVFCAAHFYFHHHVLRDDSTAEKTAGTTTEINLKLKDRRPSGH